MISWQENKGMESKSTRKDRNERLKKLSTEEMNLEELVQCVMSGEPEVLWEQEKREKEEKAAKKRKKKEKRRAK
jgi:hypothetical protein